MSIDTEVWVHRPETVGPALRRVSDDWVNDGEEWSLGGAGWQLLVYEPEEVDQVEADAGLADLIGDRSFLIAVGLEPSSAPPEAFDRLTETIRSLIEVLDGIGTDPQTGDPISTR